MRDKEKKTSVSAIDIVVLILVIACIGSAALRMFGVVNTESKNNYNSYLVTYKVEKTMQKNKAYYESGEEFFLLENDDDFGTATGDVTLTPYVEVTYDAQGNRIERTFPTTMGDNNVVTIIGTMVVNGFEDSETGRFYLNGNKVLTLNTPINIYSTKTSSAILIQNIQLIDN